MFERFTNTSRRAMALAAEETHRLGGSIIGDVELLLGLTMESRGTCCQALRRIGVDLDELRRQLDRQPRSPNDGTAPRKLPQTRDVKLTIEATIAIARELDDKHIGTEHMLLGLLRHPEFASSRILAEHAVSFDRVKEVITMIRAETESEE